MWEQNGMPQYPQDSGCFHSSRQLLQDIYLMVIRELLKFHPSCMCFRKQEEKRPRAKTVCQTDMSFLFKNLYLQTTQQTWPELNYMATCTAARWLENIITNLRLFLSQMNQSSASKEANKNAHQLSNEKSMPYFHHVYTYYIRTLTTLNFLTNPTLMICLYFLLFVLCCLFPLTKMCAPSSLQIEILIVPDFGALSPQLFLVHIFFLSFANLHPLLC